MNILCIDWAATGAMIGGIGTWAGVIGAIGVAIMLGLQNKKIAQKQFEQSENQQKIALYDKRYVVYACFIKYFNFISCIKEDINVRADLSQPYSLISDFVFDNPSIPEPSNIPATQKNSIPLTVITDLPIPEPSTATIQKKKIGSENYNLQNQIQDTIALSEFCFSEEISKALNSFNYALFDYIDIGRIHYINTRVAINTLLDIIKKIDDENIVQQMKEELNLAYEKTHPQKKKKTGF